MRIRVEELKVPGTDRFEKLRGEIVEINDRIEKDYLEIERKLYS